MIRAILVVIILVVANLVKGQTNVSGGIYSNTTWYKANSPYIVTDTVVVFPNVKLTIQPGVVVKFKTDIVLEIRQAQLIAEGTSTDSIKFTSDSLIPSAGIYVGIWLNQINLYSARFKYCSFSYAYKGIFADNNCLTNDSINISHSNFQSNHYGFYYATACNVFIDSSTFKNNMFGLSAYSGGANYINMNSCNIIYNQFGFYPMFNTHIERSMVTNNSTYGLVSEQYDTIQYNQIKNNGTGLWTRFDTWSKINNNIIENNNVGILLGDISGAGGGNGDNIYCNTICHNTQYNLQYTLTFGSNAHLPYNYWCSGDSLAIEASIYDGYDNISLGLVYVLPVDSFCELSSGVTQYDQNSNINVFPTPTTDWINIKSMEELKSIIIYNSVGNVVVEINTSSNRHQIDVAKLSPGVYLIRIGRYSYRFIKN